MDLTYIQTLDAFRVYIREILLGIAHQRSRALAAYLGALLVLVQRHHALPCSYTLAARLLTDAFETSPPAFDPGWLDISEPPQAPAAALDDSEVAEQMLRYQLADLFRMEQAGQLARPEYELWLGLDSPTGHRWYNFTPEAFLECASAALPEPDPGDRLHATYHWSDFANFLWMGQVYE